MSAIALREEGIEVVRFPIPDALQRPFTNRFRAAVLSPAQPNSLFNAPLFFLKALYN
jgi:hypothetical protein